MVTKVVHQHEAQPLHCGCADPCDFPCEGTVSPKKDRGDAAEGGRQRLVCLGLPNLGQTCFMNATLQCLFHLPSFCQDITKQKEHWGLVPSTDLMRHFTDLLTSLESGVKQKKQLLRNLMGRFSGQFTEDEQSDAQEFLTFLISQLSDLGISVQARESTATYLCPVEANLAFEMLCWKTCTRIRRSSPRVPPAGGARLCSRGHSSHCFDSVSRHKIR
ncbi:ubiquitin carboxyl-terminal hydrolase 37-like [Paramormyrops kingsleyae]|uniref:ubiquitin carboxyl-terminal hydrolase 37-like n=1 Tax=Paramormyrops kingsleyae TaxID=1676925 RepID=UPI003B972666